MLPLLSAVERMLLAYRGTLLLLCAAFIPLHSILLDTPG
jgi:hypothetical protein